MGVDTKAILRKGTTLEEIKDKIELKYGEVQVRPTSSSYYFTLVFKEPKATKNTASHRMLDVFLNEYAKIYYGIDGVLLSLGAWGSSVEIMLWLLEEFGGYLDESDSDDKDFYPVNIEAYEKGKGFTKMDLFANKVIQKLGYQNLKPALQLFEEFSQINSEQTAQC